MIRTELNNRERDANSEMSFDKAESSTSSETSSEDDSMTGEQPLFDIYNETLRNFDASIEEDDGWGWKDIEVATQLHDISTRLRHWKRSLVWLKSGVSRRLPDPELDAKHDDSVFQECLDIVRQEDTYVSEVVGSYMEDVRDGLERLRLSLELPGEENTSVAYSML